MQDGKKQQQQQQFNTTSHIPPSTGGGQQQPDLSNVTYQNVKIKCNIDNYEDDTDEQPRLQRNILDQQTCNQNVNHLEHFPRDQQFAVDGLQLKKQQNEKDLSDPMLRPAEAQSMTQSEQPSQRFVADHNNQHVRRALQQRSPDTRGSNTMNAFTSPRQQLNLPMPTASTNQAFPSQPHYNGHRLPGSHRMRPSTTSKQQNEQHLLHQQHQQQALFSSSLPQSQRQSYTQAGQPPFQQKQNKHLAQQFGGNYQRQNQILLKMQNQSMDERPDYSDDEPAMHSKKEFMAPSSKQPFRQDQFDPDALTMQLKYEAAAIGNQFGQMRFTQPELANQRQPQLVQKGKIIQQRMTSHQAHGPTAQNWQSNTHLMKSEQEVNREFPLESQGQHDQISAFAQPIKLQAERLRGSLQAHLRSAQRGTINLRSINLKQRRSRSICTYLCSVSPFRAKFYTFVNSYFDASILLLPFIFHRAGWLSCTLFLMVLHLWSYFMAIVVYECIHLMIGNFKMKQRGVDFEFLMHNFKHITIYQGSQKNLLNQSYQDLRGFTDTPWLSYTLSSHMAVVITRHLYLVSLILLSSIGIVLSQYIFDTLFLWTNAGKTYAFQLIPETKIITELSPDWDHQPFGSNFFSFSIGFGITIVSSLFLFLVSFVCSKQSSRLQGIKMLFVIAFVMALTSNFLKPHLHITTKGHLNIDWKEMKDKFKDLPVMTPSVGFMMGIFAFNSTLSQIACVPELVKVPHNSGTSSRSKHNLHNPNRHHFKLPIFLGSLFAFILKIGVGISGAIAISSATEPEEYNIFSNTIFSQKTSEALMFTLMTFALVVVLPSVIENQKQLKYFVSISSEGDPCIQYLVCLILPWLLAACINHLQIFVHLINWTSLLCLVNVAVVSSVIMWTRQLEETNVHESNFRETIKMLVVQDRGGLGGDEIGGKMATARNLRDSGSDSDGSEGRDRDSDTDALLRNDNKGNELNVNAVLNEKDPAKMGAGQTQAFSTAATNIPTATAAGPTNTSMNEHERSRRSITQATQGKKEGAQQQQNNVSSSPASAKLESSERNRRAEEILRQKNYNANITAARKFLRFGEQRGSTDSSFLGSEISNIAMDQEIDYTNVFDRKHGFDGRGIRDTQDGKGLNEQAIRIGFLDRDKQGRPVNMNMPDGVSATANAAMADFESHLPRPSKLDFYSSEDGDLIGGDDREQHRELLSDKDADDKLDLNLSQEYSKNVEANSEGSNDIKYLLGEKINIKEFERKQQPNKKKTLSQKKQAIENKFIEIYNRQGHYSMTQSLVSVYGHTFCQLTRFLQCFFCCMCTGCKMGENVDFRRFMVNVTKFLGVAMMSLSLTFALLTLNEQLAMNSSTGTGQLFLKQIKFPSVPRQY